MLTLCVGSQQQAVGGMVWFPKLQLNFLLKLWWLLKKNDDLFQSLAPQNINEQIPMLEPCQVQMSNTGSILMSMSSPNPTKVVFEVLRGTVILYYEPPSEVTHLSCWNHRLPICALGFNSDTSVN